MFKIKKALVLKFARELLLKKGLRFSWRTSRRDALAVFIVEQVALNRHVLNFSKERKLKMHHRTSVCQMPFSNFSVPCYKNHSLSPRNI